VTVSVMVGGTPASATSGLTPPSGDACAFILAVRSSRAPPPPKEHALARPAAPATRSLVQMKEGQPRQTGEIVS
jgi:hypothetical protein